MRDAFIRQLEQEAQKNQKVQLITGDLGFGVFENFIEKFPAQFLNAGVAEQNMTAIATGLAMEGFIPFTYSIANFCTLRCLEFIRNDACYHDANVNVVSVGVGFSYGPLGISHHAVEDIAIMRVLPNITIVSPGDDWETAECTKALIEKEGTGFLRLDRASVASTKIEGEKFCLGKARTLIRGRDLALVTTGGMLSTALQAASELEKLGVSCEVTHFHTIKPFDDEAIIDVASRVSRMITIEEHSIYGGLGGIVSEILLESGILPKAYFRIGLRDGFSSIVGSQDYLRDRYGLSVKHIVQKGLEFCTSKRTANA